MTKKEVAEEFARMCFRKEIETQKESYDLLSFDCKEVSNFVRGQAFAYKKMGEWIQGYILNECSDEEDYEE